MKRVERTIKGADTRAAVMTRPVVKPEDGDDGCVIAEASLRFSAEMIGTSKTLSDTVTPLSAL
jgi:hypothetical protein